MLGWQNDLGGDCYNQRGRCLSKPPLECKMEKIICPRCSEGVEIHPDYPVWMALKLAIIDWGEPLRIMRWYECKGCDHTYFISTKVGDENVA